MKAIKFGIAGVGVMGKNHCRILSILRNVDFIGIYDKNQSVCEDIANTYNVIAFSTFEDMLSKVDAVIISVPTTFHYSYTYEAIQNGKHVFVEKPFVSSLKDAEKLIEFSNTIQNCVIQVGHIERFNPVIQRLNDIMDSSKIISLEASRLCATERNLDVDVVLDLMIHDIDIILDLANSPLVSVTAIAAYSSQKDAQPNIVNALLRFENGIIASLIANRSSQKSLRTISVTEQERVLTADYLTKELLVYNRPIFNQYLSTTIDNSIEKIKVPPIEPLQAEIQHFIQSIQNQQTPIVSTSEATKALSVAMKIKESIRNGKTIFFD
ncbi:MULTISPECIES: Gfo/Idh/MocA family protein [Heyndrickxia]|uniref:Gfo/Idh/MocA family protein n=1 Tax=Heyndrickxia TaxID=2837504 RepID=UPI001BB3CB01|nr:Gfo/Idh/MocA family oxidoreductase [Heyndrickxia oleronia]